MVCWPRLRKSDQWEKTLILSVHPMQEDTESVVGLLPNLSRNRHDIYILGASMSTFDSYVMSLRALHLMWLVCHCEQPSS